MTDCDAKVSVFAKNCGLIIKYEEGSRAATRSHLRKQSHCLPSAAGAAASRNVAARDKSASILSSSTNEVHLLNFYHAT